MDKTRPSWLPPTSPPPPIPLRPIDKGKKPQEKQPAQPMSNDRLRENVSNLDEVAHKNGSSGRVALSTIRPEKVEWLWYARIPYGKLTVLDGDPGLGKSTMMLDVAARLTNGIAMPGEHNRPPKAAVLLLSAEDGLSDTIVPRLMAAGADMEKVEARVSVRDDKGDRLPEIPLDLPTLEIDIEELGALLIIIDPLVAYLGSETSARSDQDIRRALAPFAEIAQRTGAAVVVIRHLNKAQGNNAIYRGGGSIGIIAAARSGLLIAKDPEDVTEIRRILASQKCNLAPTPSALAYHMETAENGEPRIVWEGETGHTANGLLAGPIDTSEKPALNEAATFLRDMLSEGPKAVTEIKSEARAAGISDITLRRAKDIIGVVAKKTAYGQGGFWIWDFPTKDAHLAVGEPESDPDDE